jgi:GxxExxY protein
MLLRSELTEKVIGLAIKLHRRLGPGLFESVYEECLCFEFEQAGIGYARQVAIPVVYESVTLDAGFRADVIVAQELLLEIKAVEKLLPVHQAQILTYLKMSGYHIGLLLNFNALRLKHGLRRFVA